LKAEADDCVVIRFGFQQICMNKAQMNMREVLFNCPFRKNAQA